jgi:hypothetical protein
MARRALALPESHLPPRLETTAEKRVRRMGGGVILASLKPVPIGGAKF